MLKAKKISKRYKYSFTKVRVEIIVTSSMIERTIAEMIWLEKRINKASVEEFLKYMLKTHGTDWYDYDDEQRDKMETEQSILWAKRLFPDFYPEVSHD